MTTNDFDNHVQNAARAFIVRYGKDAARQAERRAEELRNFGDTEGYRLWQRIHHAIAESAKPPPDDLRH